jgi:hypothetical protein
MSAKDFYRYFAQVDSGSYGRLAYDEFSGLKYKLVTQSILLGFRVNL